MSRCNTSTGGGETNRRRLIITRPAHSDGSKIAIFEYGEDQSVKYGDRPERKTQCNGKSCRMVEINEQFAVNWRKDGRHISVVGVRNQAELENLVTSLN